MVLSAAVMVWVMTLGPAAGPRDAPARRGSSRTSVLVMPVAGVAGGSTSTGHALAQLLASSLQEQPSLSVTMYEPAVYVPHDPLVAVLARCTEERCLMELGARLGFQEVVGGTLDGDPGVLTLVRVSAEDGRRLGHVRYTMTEALLSELASEPFRMVQALYPSAAGAAPSPPARSVAAEDTGDHGNAPPRPRARAAAEAAYMPWLRLGGVAALGAAGALLLVSLLVVANYAVLWAVDTNSVLSTGRHAMTQHVAALVELGVLGTLLLLGVLWPLGLGGAAALAAGLLL